MKNIVCIISFLFFSLLYGQTSALYESIYKKGTQVISVDGDTCWVNPKRKINIERVFIFSINNENTTFYVEIIVPKLKENNRPILFVNGKYYRSAGTGSSDNVYAVSFSTNREQAEEISKELKVPCNLRKNFGDGLQFDFLPLKDDYHEGDSVYVKFKIINKSNVSLWYNHGGSQDNSNGRCNYFDFDVYYNGILLSDEGPKWDFGGEELHPELKPGQTDSLIECITKWSRFTKSGKYTIKCSYRLHLQSEYNTNKNYPDNQEDLHKAWDKKAEKTIEIIIKE